jgi:hypothetical protein
MISFKPPVAYREAVDPYKDQPIIIGLSADHQAVDTLSGRVIGECSNIVVEVQAGAITVMTLKLYLIPPHKAKLSGVKYDPKKPLELDPNSPVWTEVNFGGKETQMVKQPYPYQEIKIQNTTLADQGLSSAQKAIEGMLHKGGMVGGNPHGLDTTKLKDFVFNKKTEGLLKKASQPFLGLGKPLIKPTDKYPMFQWAGEPNTPDHLEWLANQAPDQMTAAWVKGGAMLDET